MYLYSAAYEDRVHIAANANVRLLAEAKQDLGL